MNQTTLVQIAERLERLAGKLPEKIRRPVLRELTPLKQLFLQQRRPRFLVVGSSKMPLQRIVNLLFTPDGDERAKVMLTPVHRWTDWTIPGHGTISILDARDADSSVDAQIEEELKREPADMIFFFDDGEMDLRKPVVVSSGGTKIIGLSLGTERREAQLEEALDSQPGVCDRLLTVVRLTGEGSPETRRLMSVLAAELPNEAKIEMIRISRDRQAQLHVAQMLIKSTTAICAAIGAQPIPLADMPILTSLQVLMVSGIMYVSGRERSLRAATEFITALGANLGVGMLLREGARAMLKFFPGWGNVVCGMVAGAGTYAIGRAATAYFLEGASLKEARRTYLKSRRKRSRPALPARE
ncbi:MAG: YcjF family protein [Alphaproteobacteria bacterium]